MNAKDHDLTEASLDTLLKSAHSALDEGDVQAGRELSHKVLKAAEGHEDSVFYAHLYLGLYFEATGDAVKAKEHIDLAAAKADPNNYMGDVARVHARLLKNKPAK